MISHDRRWTAATLATVCLTGATAFLTQLHFKDPFPPLSTSLSTSLTNLSDFAGITMGLRRLTADIAWIQTLEYYGTHEEGDSEDAHHHDGGHYPLFLAYCQRVSRLDPYFTYVYFYGGGVLGWNLNRLDEAETLIRQGIQLDPKQWRLQQYLAALAYQKTHNTAKLAEFLESYVREPDCPNLLRSILASLYKKQKRYADSARIWELVLDTGDPGYVGRAEEELKDLLRLLQGAYRAPS